MEIDIIDKKENKVLDRTEIKFDCIYSDEATPKILDVKSKLVALLDTKKDLIVVDSIQPRFGQAIASGYAKVYGSVDSLNDIETESIIEKNKEVEPKAEEKAEEDSEKSEPEEESVEEKDSEEVVEEETAEAETTEEESESTEEEATEEESEDEKDSEDTEEKSED